MQAGDGAASAVELIRQIPTGPRDLTNSDTKVGVGLGRNGVVVQGTDDGIRLVEVIEDVKAEHTFVYQMTVEGNDAKFKLAPDGSVLVGYGDVEAGQFEPTGSIAVPWAFDANDLAVPIYYTVSKDARYLTMSVARVDGQSYPVVADPSYHTTWYGLHAIKLNSSETTGLENLLIAGAGASATGLAVCAGLTAGMCAIPWAFGSALGGVGYLAIRACKNSNGVDIHSYWPGAVWCSGY